MQAPEFYIPIDTEISQFLLHLRTHPRTILSAKFGDGKSYFLDKFAKDSAVEDEFKIIRIYPINYQVVGDNDIFTLLKYDVLLQLLVFVLQLLDFLLGGLIGAVRHAGAEAKSHNDG